MSSDGWDSEVINHSHNLSGEQVVRLLAMTKVLSSAINLQQVAEIKENIASGDPYKIAYARESLWSEFTEEEQHALWVAPLYGGIFTTDERKALRP